MVQIKQHPCILTGSYQLGKLCTNYNYCSHMPHFRQLMLFIKICCPTRGRTATLQNQNLLCYHYTMGQKMTLEKVYVGIEPTTSKLRVLRSTKWANKIFNYDIVSVILFQKIISTSGKHHYVVYQYAYCLHHWNYLYFCGPRGAWTPDLQIMSLPL